MIQVCSRCGTRWNVRDRQRVWCPRCQGALLAPTAQTPQPQWSPAPRGAGQPQAAPPSRALPAGYRWIAVRPGAPPPAAPSTPPLGPTPRYEVPPSWGLTEQFESPAPTPEVEPRNTSSRLVGVTVTGTVIVLGVAAIVHVVRYALLLINRSTLLSPVVAGGATWGGVVVSVLAFFAMVATVVVLTGWLINRRAAAYARQGVQDPRPSWQLWVGCLLPIVNLFWAPVFVIELARFEGRLRRLRGTIVIWWCGWWLSTLVSVFSIATSFAGDAQGIANNTVVVAIAYLMALAALLLMLRVYDGFERRPVDRPVKRWVIVADGAPPQRGGSGTVDTDTGTKTTFSPDQDADSAIQVESERAEPAA